MGGCISSQKDHAKKRGKSQSFSTRFKGLSPDEASRENTAVTGGTGKSSLDREVNGQLNSSSMGRKTLGTILNEEKEPSGMHRCRQSMESKEEAWFDAEARFASDSDDEFMSVCGDTVSAGNSLNLPSGPVTPRPTFATLKEEMLKAEGLKIPAGSPKTTNGRTVLDEPIPSNKLHSEEDKKNSAGSVSLGRRLDSTPRNSSVSVAPVSDVPSEHEMGKHENQHMKSDFEGCLPCLLNTVVSFDKKSPQRRRSFRLFSFKRRSNADLNDILDLHDMSRFLHRPAAGCQVPLSDGSVEGTWSKVDASTFKLRSRNYMKDKKKQFASSMSIFEAVGVDVFLSPRKIDHIARFVDISNLMDKDPQLLSNEKFPHLFIFNIQVPMYNASVFPSECNGEGLNLVFYYRLSDAFKKDGPPYLKEMLTKLVEDEQEKVRGLVGETIVPFRERLKIVARVLNPEEIHLSGAEKKLVVTYNEKPVLSRPQHAFYKGPGYFEADLDVHRFNFIARKAVESFRERLKLCVLDIGLTIQGNKAEELPELMLCSARINKLNIGEFKYLYCEEDDLTPKGRNT